MYSFLGLNGVQLFRPGLTRPCRLAGSVWVRPPPLSHAPALPVCMHWRMHMHSCMAHYIDRRHLCMLTFRLTLTVHPHRFSSAAAHQQEVVSIGKPSFRSSASGKRKPGALFHSWSAEEAPKIQGKLSHRYVRFKISPAGFLGGRFFVRAVRLVRLRASSRPASPCAPRASVQVQASALRLSRRLVLPAPCSFVQAPRRSGPPVPSARGRAPLCARPAPVRLTARPIEIDRAPYRLTARPYMIDRAPTRAREPKPVENG